VSTPLAPLHITSRDNPLLVRLRRLSQDGSAYRKLGQVWLEGEHLCAALLQRGGQAAQAVCSESAWQVNTLRDMTRAVAKVVVLPDALFKTISGLESPSNMGFVMDLPPAIPLQAQAPSLVLDGVQDAGNVGSMLRSAAAMGVAQVVALKGTARCCARAWARTLR
jgi:RNA methyltransferase, TrmH family